MDAYISGIDGYIFGIFVCAREDIVCVCVSMRADDDDALFRYEDL